MPSPILARADALMQRRHLSNNDPEEVPVLTDAIDVDDDIPVLLDVAATPGSQTLPDDKAPDETTVYLETQKAPARPVVAHEPAPHPAIDPAWRDALVDELSCRIEQRLLLEIPKIIESTVQELLAEQEILARHPPD
jgi:hypothetical protein